MKIYDEDQIERWVIDGTKKYPILKKYNDVTDLWKKHKQPIPGEVKTIKLSIGTNSMTGKSSVFNASDDSVRMDDDIKEEEKEIGKWFKNNIFGNVMFQMSVKKPQNIKTADLALTHKYFLLREQTVEIKTISNQHTSVSAFSHRVASGHYQSSNILLDISNYKYPDQVIPQVRECYRKLPWLETLIIKNGDELQAVYKRR